MATMRRSDAAGVDGRDHEGSQNSPHPGHQPVDLLVPVRKLADVGFVHLHKKAPPQSSPSTKPAAPASHGVADLGDLVVVPRTPPTLGGAAAAMASMSPLRPPAPTDSPPATGPASAPAAVALNDLPSEGPRFLSEPADPAKAAAASTTPPSAPCNSRPATSTSGLYAMAMTAIASASPTRARTTIHLRPIRSPSRPHSGVVTTRASAGAAIATPAQAWICATPWSPCPSGRRA